MGVFFNLCILVLLTNVASAFIFVHVLSNYLPNILFSVVSKLSQGGEDDLTEMRQKVGVLSEETSVALKKNVYKNYSQFIETAKEISSILFKLNRKLRQSLAICVHV